MLRVESAYVSRKVKLAETFLWFIAVIKFLNLYWVDWITWYTLLGKIFCQTTPRDLNAHEPRQNREMYFKNTICDSKSKHPV